MKITDFVKNDNKAHFSYYRAGFFFYNTANEKGMVYQFPIPLDDLGQATLKKTEKAITLMRYLRQSIQDNTFILQP